jgi:hypothetical protein
VRALAEHVTENYGGDASRVWTDASDGRDLQRRLAALPSFGEMKVSSMLAILHNRFGVRLSGLEDLLPGHPTLGDVDSAEALAAYQEKKRAYKAKLRAEA